MRGGTIGCVVAKFDGAAVLSDRTPCRKCRPDHWQLMICQAVTAIFLFQRRYQQVSEWARRPAAAKKAQACVQIPRRTTDQIAKHGISRSAFME